MKQETLDFLYQPFDVHTKPGKGQFKFVESKDVIDRMNKAFMGNWSSEVLDSEVVEDNIVVWARVKVIDPETQQEYHQDGYGSSMIQRFTFGDNQGKPVDLGNSYKSALSKAVKAACSRWGAGLYIDGDEATSDAGGGFIPPASTPATPPASTPPPAAPPASTPPTPSAPPAEPAPPAGPTPPAAPPSGGTSIPTPPTAAPSSTPAVPPPASTPPAGNTQSAPPAAPPTGGIPSVPSPGGASSAPLGTTSGAGGGPSDVQKAALEGLLTVRKFDYNELVKNAFETNGMDASTIPSRDELTADQATVIISYGNKAARNA
jgi:hypothetical protein